MASYTFNPINFTLDEIVESDKMGAELELHSGLYQVEIKQASLRKSQNTNAHAITFLVDVIKDKAGNAYGVTNQEISIWFLKADGTPIDFSAKKIGSLLYLCGLPTQISGECFVDDTIIAKEFNDGTGKYEEVKKQGLNFKSLIGKKIWALIAIKYENYQDRLVKRYDFDSFYNDKFKTVSEIKENKEAKKWDYRVKYADSIEKETYEKCKSLNDNAQAHKIEQAYNPYGYDLQTETNFNDEIPF